VQEEPDPPLRKRPGPLASTTAHLNVYQMIRTRIHNTGLRQETVEKDRGRKV